LTKLSTKQVRAVFDTNIKVVECAVVGNADYIVTGDKHLLALKQYGNIAIVKAAEFLKIVQARLP